MRAALALMLVACGVDTGRPSPGDDVDPTEPTTDPVDPPVDPTDPGTGTGTVTEVAGHITASTTWSEAIHMTGTVIVDPGVTLTLAPGTTVDAPEGTELTVGGTLDIQGTKDHKVTLRGETGNFWDGISVLRTGTLTARYLVQTGGNVTIVYTGKATIVDSHFSHARGDLVVMSSGTLDMSYSEIGLPTGRDTMHCDLHIGGAPTVKITHTNLSAAGYALMFYGGQNADFTHNNWFGNVYDIITEAGPPVTGDFSSSYFAKGAPTNPGVTVHDLQPARVADAGPR